MNSTTEKPKRTKGRKSATEAARLLYLYGEGDGVRILDVKELSAKSGVHEVTIRGCVKEWQNELEETLRSSSKLGPANSLSVPSETMEAHRSDVDFIRQRLDKAKSELSALPSIVADLRSLIESIHGDEDKIDTLIQLFDRYLRLSMNEKSLTKLFMDLKALWDAKSGVDSLKNIQEATAKAVSIAASKQSEPSPQQEGVVPVGGVFSKRG